jgi:hypothetical protein
MAMNSAGMSSKQLLPGNVVYCDYLHLNEAKKDPQCHAPVCAGKYRYVVFGKPRPVLIVQRLDEVDGTIWYRICKIVRKQSRRQYSLGEILEGKGPCYANLEPECYPDNLLESRIIKKLDDPQLKNILQYIGDLILGKRIPGVF